MNSFTSVLTRHVHVLIFTLHWYLVGFEMFGNLSSRENSISVSLYDNNINLYENNIDFERTQKQSPGVIPDKSFSEKFYKACRKISFTELFFASAWNLTEKRTETRSSRPKVICIKCVPRNFSLVIKRLWHSCFPFFCKISKNTSCFWEVAIGGVLYKKSVSKNFAKFKGKYLSRTLFFNKVSGLRPVNFAKFWRTAFLQNTCKKDCSWKNSVDTLFKKFYKIF